SPLLRHALVRLRHRRRAVAALLENYPHPSRAALVQVLGVIDAFAPLARSHVVIQRDARGEQPICVHIFPVARDERRVRADLLYRRETTTRPSYVDAATPRAIFAKVPRLDETNVWQVVTSHHEVRPRERLVHADLERVAVEPDHLPEFAFVGRPFP